MPEENERQINMGNVFGDAIISNNQSGGITAHTVNFNSAPKPALLQESHKKESLILIIGNKDGLPLGNILGTIKFESEVDKIQIGTAGTTMAINNSNGQLSENHLSYSFSSAPLPGGQFLKLIISPIIKGIVTFR